MKYVGIQTQISRNNFNSFLLICMFPCIILGMLWVFCCIFGYQEVPQYNIYGEESSYYSYFDFDVVNDAWMTSAPIASVITGVWLIIAYFYNVKMIQKITGAKPLERKDNPRVYNLVENLCISCGMTMPKVNIIYDDQLNAFASGINEKTYTVTLTQGIIDCLNDEELEGVIAHELTHIRNRDTKVLIISIVFVGILSTVLSFISQFGLRLFLYGGSSRSRSSEKKGSSGAAVIVVILAAIVCTAIAYFLTLLTRFAISRKREFMADAGGAELTHNPLALASALRKISGNPGLGNINREDVAQLFIIHPKDIKQSFLDKLQSIFSTHPDTEERIRILEQF